MPTKGRKALDWWVSGGTLLGHVYSRVYAHVDTHVRQTNQSAVPIESLNMSIHMSTFFLLDVVKAGAAAGTSPTLSNKAEYGLFSRTVASETSKGPALLGLMRRYNWKKAVMATSIETALLESGFGLARQFEAAGIDIIKPVAFEPRTDSLKLAVLLRNVKRSGVRIVFLLAFQEDMQTIASIVENEAMSVGWSWISPEERVPFQQIQGWLYLRPFLPSEGMQAFAKQVSDYTKLYFDVTTSPELVDLTYSVALHDAVMLYAHAATKVLSEGGSLQDGHAVTAAVRNTTFKGVGNRTVALDENGDRIEVWELMNYVLTADGRIDGVPVALYNSTLLQYMAYEQEVVWPGGTTKVPSDYFSGASQSCSKY